MKECEIYSANVKSEEPSTSTPKKRLGTFASDVGTLNKKSIKLSLKSSTSIKLSRRDLTIEYPFSLEFIKLDNNASTPVDIPYTFTATGEFDWQITLNPTETSEVLVMARG